MFRNLWKVISRISTSQKMASSDVLLKLETQATNAETIIQSLKTELSELQALAANAQKNALSQYQKKFDAMREENVMLKGEIESLKKKLLASEGRDPVVLKVEPPSPVATESTKLQSKDKVCVAESPAGKAKKEKIVTPKEKKPQGEKNKSEVPSSNDDLPVDVGRLDFRVGRIVNVKKHPDADSLYVEEVDVGEAKPRTVVSGLVKHVPIEEMQNRLVVLLCNLKPAKMRGVLSEAMVMCASTPDKVEILNPPSSASPGDQVHFDGYPRSPDAVLNPKKKIFESVAPDLKTDENLVATYKGVAFTVPDKGSVTTATLKGVNIK